MAALDPIAGISLERYADLAAKMKDTGGDLDKCAAIAEQNGVDRASWEAAMNGWNQRMQSPDTAAEVALAYMPLYQAALAKTGDVATASLEDYAGMIVMLNHPKYGLDAMYAHYGIDVNKWGQITTYWTQKVTTDMELNGKFSGLVGGIRNQLDAGGPPPTPNQGSKPQGISGDDVVAASQAVASLPPVAEGNLCCVRWSDGKRYAGEVVQAGQGQCLIKFPNGHQQWVPNSEITNRGEFQVDPNTGAIIE